MAITQRFWQIPALPILLLVLLFVPQVQAGEEEFLELQQKLEADVLEFRAEVEKVYESRCSPVTLQNCHRGNYDACRSSFPNPICPTGDDFRFDVCAAGCSSRWDYSISTVQLPPSSHSEEDPTDLEDVCFSQGLDAYFVDKYAEDRDYWERWGIDNPSMHFGTANGVFRMYPARANETCNTYDPRVRPWYIAGSSGPKNIVLLLDTSGSMDGLRLLYLKQAAIRIIDTLTVGDRVALVPFSTTAQDARIEGRSLVKVTASVKQVLKRGIDDLQAIGSTNIYDAFRRAFEILEEAIPLELVVDCNTAILFLTDGKMTDPPDTTEAMVLDFVKQGLADLEASLSHPVHLFSYSISENDDVHTFPKQLACSSTDHGVWSKVVDDRTIVDSLTSYSKLFSLGLGEGKNDDFTAWVEPYTFSTRGEEGVTVSAPAFDRSVDPPILIGVVGLDLLVKALDRALGVAIGSSETLDRIVQSSTAKCPKLQTTSCQLEGFRSLGGDGNEGLCGVANCSWVSFSLEGNRCANQDDLPTNTIANRELEAKSFVERACCSVVTGVEGDSSFLRNVHDMCVATSLPRQQDESGGSNSAAVIGGAVGGALGLCLLLCGALFCSKKVDRQGRTTTVPSLPQARAVFNDGCGKGVMHTPVRVVALDVTPLPTNPEASAPAAEQTW